MHLLIHAKSPKRAVLYVNGKPVFRGSAAACWAAFNRWVKRA